MVNYIPTKSKTILTKHRYTDDWFISKYGMNIYRGCEHSCAYCDGRAEKYRVEGTFGEDIYVKTNAVELLKKELPKIREKAIIFVGGGVGDSYQRAELKFNLTSQVLELLKKFNFPIHILTKSHLIERDFDIIREINEKSGAIVSFSLSTIEEKIAKIFEPDASSPDKRLSALKKFSGACISTGVMFMPQIPFISDNEKSITDVVSASKKAGGNFILPAGMTLKEGRQKKHFMKIIKEKFPGFVENYEMLYKNSGQWGNPDVKYYNKINGFDLNKLNYKICKNYKMPVRIPYEIFKDKIELKYEVAVILAHIGYYLKMEGKGGSSYRKSAFKIQKSGIDFGQRTLLFEKVKIKGAGEFINNLIDEIVNERKCDFYDKLRIIN
ncbi:hypothetical protein BEH94_09160 [Candidatus Altiarchaeales archaeon WOR_SM1_SCG]|nr:hypothetical protein BEH94_09160 [Candidatus Altiarchaeales archaeon WOR_SM1_SCG]